MPVLAAPLGLIALAAAVLPLLIHLARRTETQPTDFAALRWLRQKPRPRHRPRLDERLLLAARLLLILLFALWLARPILPGSADRTPVVAFALGTQPFAVAGSRRLWLAPGFPPVEQKAGDAMAETASLMRQLDAELPAGVPLTLVVPERLTGVDAERPRLSRSVTWRIVPGAATTRRMAAPVPDLVVRFAPERMRQLRYWRAAATAWEGRIEAAGTEAPLPASTRHLVWLAGGMLPAAVVNWVERGGVALVPVDAQVAGRFTTSWRDATGLPLAETIRIGRGRIVRLTRDATPAAMPVLLDGSFPVAVRALLSPSPAPALVAAQDHRPEAGKFGPEPPVRDLRLPLALAIALAWLGERWLATSRRRRGTP